MRKTDLLLEILVTIAPEIDSMLESIDKTHVEMEIVNKVVKIPANPDEVEVSIMDNGEISTMVEPNAPPNSIALFDCNISIPDDGIDLAALTLYVSSKSPWNFEAVIYYSPKSEDDPNNGLIHKELTLEEVAELDTHKLLSKAIQLCHFFDKKEAEKELRELLPISVLQDILAIVSPEIESIFKLLVLRDKIKMAIESYEEMIEEGVIDGEPIHENTKLSDLWLHVFLALGDDIVDRYQDALAFWAEMTKKEFDASFQWLDEGDAHFDPDYELIRLLSDCLSFPHSYLNCDKDYDLYVTSIETFEAHDLAYLGKQNFPLQDVASLGTDKILSRVIELCRYFKKSDAEQKLLELQSRPSA